MMIVGMKTDIQHTDNHVLVTVMIVGIKGDGVLITTLNVGMKAEMPRCQDI
jgi:hypothetical protein